MSTVEAQILTRVIAPEDSAMDKKAAEAILEMGFKSDDKERMEELAEKARQGTLTPDERTEADSYERVAYFISLLKSKARRSLASTLA
jgi:hypothetical protein